MEKSEVVLRVHHLISLRDLNIREEENYFGKILRNGIVEGDINERYSAEDLMDKAKFYQSITPDTPIIVLMGIDEVCRSCCNYDARLGCTEFSEEQLMFEDQRTLENSFSHLIPKVISERPVYLNEIVQ